MIEFFDKDPDDQDARQRLKAGFRSLADDLQARVDAEKALARQRASEQAEAFNAKMAVQEGFFVPAGGEIEISPTLAKILGIPIPKEEKAGE